MGLFGGKKESGVPDIPPAPQMSFLPEASEPQELPTFPSTLRNESLNQEMVKSAVNDSPADFELPELPGIPESPLAPAVSTEEPMSGIPELPTRKPVESGGQRAFDSAIPDLATQAPLEKDVSRGVEPIFVRIDKFQDAKDDLLKVQEKTKEMKDTLKKINDVRKKEEEELKEWEEEVEKLKSLLQEIDQEVFNRL